MRTFCIDSTACRGVTSCQEVGILSGIRHVFRQESDRLTTFLAHVADYASS